MHQGRKRDPSAKTEAGPHQKGKDNKEARKKKKTRHMLHTHARGGREEGGGKEEGEAVMVFRVKGREEGPRLQAPLVPPPSPLIVSAGATRDLPASRSAANNPTRRALNQRAGTNNKAKQRGAIKSKTAKEKEEKTKNEKRRPASMQRASLTSRFETRRRRDGGDEEAASYSQDQDIKQLVGIHGVEPVGVWKLLIGKAS